MLTNDWNTKWRNVLRQFVLHLKIINMYEIKNNLSAPHLTCGGAQPSSPPPWHGYDTYSTIVFNALRLRHVHMLIVLSNHNDR